MVGVAKVVDFITKGWACMVGVAKVVDFITEGWALMA
jgi:hypothetical protein